MIVYKESHAGRVNNMFWWLNRRNLKWRSFIRVSIIFWETNIPQIIFELKQLEDIFIVY